MRPEQPRKNISLVGSYQIYLKTSAAAEYNPSLFSRTSNCLILEYMSEDVKGGIVSIYNRTHRVDKCYRIANLFE